MSVDLCIELSIVSLFTLGMFCLGIQRKCFVLSSVCLRGIRFVFDGATLSSRYTKPSDCDFGLLVDRDGLRGMWFRLWCVPLTSRFH